jgi:ubiquinone/menaquinone biosynthesis C-methylase UbiE
MIASRLLTVCLAALAAQAVSHAQLGSRTAEEWVATLESPQRLEGLRIGDVVQRLGLRPGHVVADIGAGSGAFDGALSSAVSPGGVVYAEEVDQTLLDHIATRAKALGVTNLRPVLGTFTDPRLPTRDVDLAFVHDVLHHIEQRAAYLKTLAGYLRPTGRIAVIDFHPGQGGHRDVPALQVSKEQTGRWMAEAGLRPLEDFTIFPDKWFVIYGR